MTLAFLFQDINKTVVPKFHRTSHLIIHTTLISIEPLVTLCEPYSYSEAASNNFVWHMITSVTLVMNKVFTLAKTIVL